MMIAAFSQATEALKPGEISQPVETQYGFHIIQRLPYAEVAKDYNAQYSQNAGRSAADAYVAKAESTSNVQVKDNAPSAIKDAVKDETKHRNDKSVLASYTGGTLTVSDFLGWLESFPPSQQITQRIPQAPDSILKPFVKQIAVQQVMLRRADSAHVDIPAEEKNAMYTQIGQLVGNVWQALGIDPKSLSDSAKSTSEKERLAAARVDAYLDRMMSGQAQPLSIPRPLKKILDTKYEASVNSAGIDRAFERAQKLRQSADSARSASQPKSQIPIPGMGGPPGGSSPPAGAQPGNRRSQRASRSQARPAPGTKKP